MYKTARQKDAASIEKLEVELKEREKTIVKLQAETQTLTVGTQSCHQIVSLTAVSG
jgi:hypothetical protein